MQEKYLLVYPTRLEIFQEIFQEILLVSLGHRKHEQFLINCLSI